MTDNEFSLYLTERYQPAILWYDRKATKYKLLYYLFQITLIIVSAITPVFILINWNIIATISGIIVAICASLNKFMKLEELWTNYRSICETLKKEKYLFQAGLANYESENKKMYFVDSIEGLISRENTLWVSLASKTKLTSDKNNID